MKKLNFKRAASLALTSAFLTSVTACGTNNFNQELLNNQVSSLSADSGEIGKKWTILVHLAADNNLYSAGLDDINEMEATLTSPDVNVIVLFDGAKQGDSAIYKISKDKNGYDDKIVSPKINDKGAIIPANHEIDSGDPKVFAKFMDWGTKNYPAEHTAVIIWNHGSGIFKSRNSSQVLKPIKAKPGSAGSITTNGFAWDDNGGNMNLKDLKPAFAAAMKNTGKTLDILDFDACLMAHVESAYQIQGQVNYLVASEKTEPGDGNDYEAMFKALSANPSMTGAQFASTIVDAYGKSYSGGSQGTDEVTLSATDVNAVVTGLVPAINELAGSLTASPSVASTPRTNTESYENSDSGDLGHFVTLLGKEAKAGADVKSAALKVREELSKSVIREVHVSRKIPKGVDNATGLVIYFPTKGYSINPKYLNPAEIRFAEQPAWANFLKAFVKTAR
jgi:hypothetical protein